jgi:hypothetical protein
MQTGVHAGGKTQQGNMDTSASSPVLGVEGGIVFGEVGIVACHVVSCVRSRVCASAHVHDYRRLMRRRGGW